MILMMAVYRIQSQVTHLKYITSNVNLLKLYLLVVNQKKMLPERSLLPSALKIKVVEQAAAYCQL